MKTAETKKRSLQLLCHSMTTSLDDHVTWYETYKFSGILKFMYVSLPDPYVYLLVSYLDSLWETDRTFGTSCRNWSNNPVLFLTFQFGSQTEHVTDVTNFRDSFCGMWNFRKKNISYSRIMEKY